MNYYRVSIIADESGALKFSTITEHEFAEGQFEAGSWEKPITRVITSDESFEFIALVPEYLEAMLAGIGIKVELDEYLQRRCGKKECCRNTAANGFDSC